MYEPTFVTDEKINNAYEKAKLHLDIVQKAKQEWTYQEIADLYGLTRQRIEQIIKRLAMDGKRINNK